MPDWISLGLWNRPLLVRRLLRAGGMQETPSVDGNVFIWSLSILVIALVVAAMLYALGIGLENITRIGV